MKNKPVGIHMMHIYVAIGLFEVSDNENNFNYICIFIKSFCCKIKENNRMK